MYIMKNTIYSFLIALAAASAVTSCTDERLWTDSDIIGDGEAKVAATATFKSFVPALDDSRTVGTAVDGITSLTVYAFDQTGNELIDYKAFTADQLTALENNTQKPADGSGVAPEVSTSRVTFSFPLQYGKYKIYAVANADMSSYAITDEASLKAIAFDWQADITKNSQMFGWFDTKDATAIKAPHGFNAPVVTVNKKDMPLTAWLVRLASKVTVSYDASKLKDNVFIFLKSVQIKDIPVSCALGESNTPSESELIKDGEIYYYYDTTQGDPQKSDYNPATYPAVLTQHVNDFGSDHSHAADALFFYENNQGTGKNKGQDVLMNDTGTPGSDGKIDYPDGNNPAPDTGYKDEKRAGTYIEVKAYYRSNEVDRLGEGEITYRFMLGQNTTTDYNAKRNYHYKLTLKFNGYANDVDWHIEYTPEPDIYIPNPYYISYIYDKSMTLPVQVTGEMEPGSELKAEIIQNDWMPYNYEKQEYAPADQYYSPGSYNYDETQQLWNGFLSLRNTGHVRDIAEGKGLGPTQAAAENEKYWTENERGFRNYSIEIGEHPDSKDGDYDVVLSNQNDKSVRVFNVPLYTRAKNLVKTSGYTGNNPYVSYQRKAVVKFTAKLKNPETGNYEEVSKTADIIQVRRVVNPKGIWRAHNEDGSFHVHLMRLETEFTTDPWQSTGQFQTFTSQGPWTAEVMVEGGDNSKGWIKLSGIGRSTLGSDGKIHGENGSEIEFNYQPNGTISENQVRYGIIKVRYHNYTCEHLIFVRQGYAPIAVSSAANATEWYSFNMRTKSEMTESPCEEGSLFKRFSWSSPISPLNNKEGSPFQAAPGDLDIFGEQSHTQKWSDWLGNADGTNDHWADPTVPNESMRVAEVDDYLQLYNDQNVQYGFGILYDGQADEVQVPVKDAYSYYYDSTTGTNGKGRGMRGCFVYNQDTGAQIFLPLGASGYGRRRHRRFYNQGGNFYAGELIYGGRDKIMEEAAGLGWHRPILFDLYRRPGAIYWCNKTKAGTILNDNDTENSVAWDFNYITFDFYPISRANVITVTEGVETNATDALLIRCVVKKNK